MGFNNVLAKLLEERGLKQADLVEATGIPSSLVSNYIKGVKSPGLKNALKIANALGVSLETLSGKKNEEKTPREIAEQRILEKFRVLSPELQDDVIRFCNFLIDENTKKIKESSDAVTDVCRECDDGGTGTPIP